MAAKLLRKKEVQARVGLSDASIYRMETAGKFPRRVLLTSIAVAWLESDIEKWILERTVAPLAMQTVA